MRNEATFFLHFSELSPHAWFLDNIQLYSHRYWGDENLKECGSCNSTSSAKKRFVKGK